MAERSSVAETEQQDICSAESHNSAADPQNAADSNVNQENNSQEQQAEAGQQQGNSEDGEKAGEGDEDEDEDPGECGFCLFMKGGPCKENFINWENCVEQAEKEKEDIVEKCHKITFLLKECMEANPDYYDPILQAEKAMAESVAEQESQEKYQESQQQEEEERNEPSADNNAQSCEHEATGAQTSEGIPSQQGTSETEDPQRHTTVSASS